MHGQPLASPVRDWKKQTPREAFLAAEAIAESRKLISMDMVEVNPFLDTANKSGILASELIQSALGKSVY